MTSGSDEQQRKSFETRLSLIERLMAKNGRYALPARLGTEGSQVTDWDQAAMVGFYWSEGTATNAPVPLDGVAASGWAGFTTYHPGTDGQFRLLQEVRETRAAQSNRVWRRYSEGSTWTPWRTQGPFEGTTTRRNATVPAYLDQWFDTTDGKVYLGSKTGTWRQMEGTISAPLRAWDSVTGGNAGRTDSLTLPTVLEANEDVLMWLRTGGSGFTFMSQSTVTRNPTDTGVSVRLMQLMSSTTQAFTIGWRIEPVAV